MYVCIEEIAPELIVHNTDVQESDLANVQIQVFCRNKTAQKSAKRNIETGGNWEETLGFSKFQTRSVAKKNPRVGEPTRGL